MVQFKYRADRTICHCKLQFSSSTGPTGLYVTVNSGSFKYRVDRTICHCKLWFSSRTGPTGIYVTVNSGSVQVPGRLFTSYRKLNSAYTDYYVRGNQDDTPSQWSPSSKNKMMQNVTYEFKLQTIGKWSQWNTVTPNVLMLGVFQKF